MHIKQLIKKTKKDYKLDLAATWFSAAAMIIVFIYWLYGALSVSSLGISILNFLIWFNALLITKRELMILENMGALVV